MEDCLHYDSESRKYLRHTLGWALSGGRRLGSFASSACSVLCDLGRAPRSLWACFLTCKLRLLDSIDPLSTLTLNLTLNLGSICRHLGIVFYF